MSDATDALSYWRSTPIADAVVRSDWLDVAWVRIEKGPLFVGDATLYPDGVRLKMAAGDYDVQVRFQDEDGDRRVAEMRVVSGTDAVLGRVVGEVSVDFGQIGVCDHARIQAASKGKSEEESLAIVEVMNGEDPCGVVAWDEASGAIMPFVSAGYGDGAYRVRELKAGGRRVGIQIDFLEELDEGDDDED